MTDSGRSVIVLGATGLVGHECLRLLLDDPGVAHVVAVVRRPLADDLASPKLRAEVVDFDRLPEYGELFAVDQIFCALGTTIKQAGSQAAFRRVDLEYPLAAAQLGAERGVRHFCWSAPSERRRSHGFSTIASRVSLRTRCALFRFEASRSFAHHCSWANAVNFVWVSRSANDLAGLRRRSTNLSPRREWPKRS